MYIEAQVVARAMRKVLSDAARERRLGGGRLQNVGGAEELRESRRGLLVDLLVGCPDLHQRDRVLLRGEHQLVGSPLRRREGRTHGIGPRDIAGVAEHLGACIHHNQLAIGERRIVGLVVQHIGPVAARHDRVEGGAGGPLALEGRLDDALQLRLVHARPHRLHACQMSGSRHACCLCHHLELVRLLEHAKPVQNQLCIRDLGRPAARPATPLAAAPENRDDRAVVGLIVAEGEVEAVHRGDERREPLRHGRAAVDLVGTELLSRALQPQADSVPALFFRLALPHKQVKRRRAGHRAQEDGGLGLREPREVVEVRREPVVVVGITAADLLTRAEHQQPCVGPHLFHHRRAVSRKVELSVLHRNCLPQVIWTTVQTTVKLLPAIL